MGTIAGRQPGIVEAIEAARYVGQVIEDGSPTCLRRVRRQDRHDAQPCQEDADVVGAHTLSNPLVNRGRDRLDDRCVTPIAAAKNANAMLLLGNVHQLKLLSEDVGDVRELGRLQSRHALGEGLASRTAALCAKLGGDRSKRIDDSEGVGARALGNRLVEQASQKPNVVEKLFHVLVLAS
jgi:hypothetical protein